MKLLDSNSPTTYKRQKCLGLYILSETIGSNYRFELHNDKIRESHNNIFPVSL